MKKKIESGENIIDKGCKKCIYFKKKTCKGMKDNTSCMFAKTKEHDVSTWIQY